jgi:hypothetical protein
MLTYMLYTKRMTSKTGYRFNMSCRHVESLPCLTGHKFCIQHVGQHSPAPVSHIYLGMLNLYPVLLVICFVYKLTYVLCTKLMTSKTG